MIEACHLSSDPHHSHNYVTSQSQLFHHYNFLPSGGSLNKINLPKFMAAAATLSSPLPSPPPHSHHHDISPLFILLLVLALIGIPILIYGFFMIIKCPPNLFRRRPSPNIPAVRSSPIKIGDNMAELVSDLKYNKEEDAKEYGGECPVCLSAFADGEDVRQLKACKHVFHGACIDMWLQSHSNCPVCRGPVPVKRTKKPVTVGRYRDDDFRQGLPDSASMV